MLCKFNKEETAIICFFAGKIQERIDKKRAYFHLVAWSFPLILTITTMALGEIDGDYVTGICFVGMVNTPARIGLLLTPLAMCVIASGYITVKGLQIVYFMETI